MEKQDFRPNLEKIYDYFGNDGRLLTAKQCAEYLGICENTFRRRYRELLKLNREKGGISKVALARAIS